jgi:AcrR family transcriptional regulator
MNENSPPAPQRSGRATRKSQTRGALIQAAAELFAELGYADTTLEAIAVRAKVHVQTLYRHFPNKESLAVAPEWDHLERFKIAVRQKDPEQPFSGFWREWVSTSAEKTQTSYRQSLVQKITDTLHSPAVAGQLLPITKEYINLLENGLADELNLDPRASNYPRLFAAMMWGGNSAAAEKWADSYGRTDLVEEVTDVVDDVCMLMRVWISARDTNLMNTPVSGGGGA